MATTKEKWENIASDEDEDDDVQDQPETEQKTETVAQTTTTATEGQEQKTEYKKPVRQTKWEIIDAIKMAETQQVVINIYKVVPEATWKDIKDTYKEFQMRIVQNQRLQGQFNLFFNNHNDAINFVKVSPREILGKKFFMRFNNKINIHQDNQWKEMGTAGHTSKYETAKFFKQKSNNKKPFHQKKGENESGENKEEDENATEETTTNATTTEKTAEGEEKQEENQKKYRPRKISSEQNGGKTTADSNRFIGDSNKPRPQFLNRNKNTSNTEKETKEPEEKKEENWNTVKDPVKEKKAEDIKKKAEDKKQKELAAQAQAKAAQKAQEVKKEVKSVKNNFADGWND